MAGVKLWLPPSIVKFGCLIHDEQLSSNARRICRMVAGVAPILGGQLGGVRVPNQLHRLSHRAVCCRRLHPESDAGSQTGILCYTAETPCPGAIPHLGTRLIGVGTRFAAPPEAHPKRRHRNDGDDIAWRIEPSQLELVRTLPHRPRRSLWAGGPSDNG